MNSNARPGRRAAAVGNVVYGKLGKSGNVFDIRTRRRRRNLEDDEVHIGGRSKM
jgi:hypothetical protein